ncbi:hypothetical protein BGX27_004962 [Mortierella sp. AM989]|nr:hypothetical protein BGX27_004962 [Mortierella sp. AM989]
MPPPTSRRSAIASVKYHVQQWVNLVLYNSIYQNIFLLHLYRLFKFIYGFFDRSTELSRICGANNWRTPLDSLWDQEGNVMYDIVNEKHVGTIVYTNVGHPHLHSIGGNGVAAGGRRGSVQSEPAATTTTTTAAGKNSTDSPLSTQLSQDSGANPQGSTSFLSATSSNTVVEENHEDSSSLLSELKHRKKGASPSAVNSNISHVHMDLRQSRSAAGLIYRIDRCILFSKQLTLERRELELPDNDPVQITHQILRKKRFPDGGSPDTPAAKKLQYALDKIASTHQLAREINQRMQTRYDSTNPAHERKLMHLWELLCPQKKLDGRYTKQWTEIGFQGKDPATDFRGMGMLGLDDLVYYAKYYPVSSKHALECSQDEYSWYSYAIVGINITAFAVHTLRTRQLQYFLFLNGTDISVYHELYCYLFHRFNDYWTTLEPKPIIMDFERVFGDFKIMMERQLARRKLMMLKYDTKENLGTSGYPAEEQLRRQQTQDSESIELEDKKSK